MICKMKSGFSGPRYDKIMERSFEIQLRTLCMHCWAAVSHYVDYKGEWDVPDNLKMALSALSGLFYVADNQFEQFNASMIASKQAAEKSPDNIGLARDINLDTVTALLRLTFPDRRVGGAAMMSKLVQEIKAAGYHSLDQVESDLNAARQAVLDYEESRKRGILFFTDIGAARTALRAASTKFAKLSGRMPNIPSPIPSETRGDPKTSESRAKRKSRPGVEKE
jgi:putative GTP pyrophosphokinase